MVILFCGEYLAWCCPVTMGADDFLLSFGWPACNGDEGSLKG